MVLKQWESILVERLNKIHLTLKLFYVIILPLSRGSSSPTFKIRALYLAISHQN